MLPKIPISNVLIQFILIIAIALAAFAATDIHEANSEKVIKEKPIIIHTQGRDYDQPTLKEYQECHENLDKCLKVCETTANARKCEAECPKCPMLTSEDVAIQGINDTDYKVHKEAPVNTTNILRITNEIHNLIDNNMGNMTARNENNIHIHQNISTTGGKFGLGYNEKGSCCHVVRAGANCDEQRFSTAQRCHHKRLRVCGERCKAHTMYAKRIRRCTVDGDNCKNDIIYTTTPRRRRDSAPCRYMPQWPYISCPRQQNRRQQKMPCGRCMSIPYYQVVQNGMPPQCMSCFGGYNVGMPNYVAPYWNSQPWYAPPMRNPMQMPSYSDDFYDDENLLPHRGGWQIEKTKCRNPDGSIDDNCNENSLTSGSGDEEYLIDDNASAFDRQPAGIMPQPNTDYNDMYDYGQYADDYDADDFGEVETARRRRHIFRRSKYSRRNMKKV